METSAPQNPQTPQPETDLLSRRTQIIIIVVAVVMILGLIGLIVAMALNADFARATRDIIIVLVGLESFLMGIALIFIAIQLQVLIRMLRDEIQPLLRSVNDTASTVRGTTEFVSQNMVSPIIKVAGFTAGVSRVMDDIVMVVKGARPRPKTISIQQGGKRDGETGK